MLTDREVGDLVNFMQRTLERLKARGMPEMDAEVKWWIRKGQAVVDPGPMPPIIK